MKIIGGRGGPKLTGGRFSAGVPACRSIALVHGVETFSLRAKDIRVFHALAGLRKTTNRALALNT